MGRRTDGIDGRGSGGSEGRPGPPPLPARGPLHDRHWAGELRGAIRCAGALLALLVLVDAAAGTLSLTRAALWIGLALLLFLFLLPPRVTAGEGWLAVRGPWRSHRVRTDRLVGVRTTGRVGQRLILRDALGGRVELDPRVLIGNPSLWLRLDTDARLARTRGSLHQGRAALDHLSERVDRETALAIFKVSGMEE